MAYLTPLTIQYQVTHPPWLVRAVLGAGFAHVDTGFVQRDVWWLDFVLCSPD
jgi:hypothetical protein